VLIENAKGLHITRVRACVPVRDACVTRVHTRARVRAYACVRITRARFQLPRGRVRAISPRLR